MTTYTYDPLIGKTSETDPTGKSVIYQYDGLNRLQTVRDQDNNILKQYDYKYQAKPVPQVFNAYFVNSTNYPAGITTATIDVPAPGLTSTLPVVLTAGSHTVSLSNGPSDCYSINATYYTANQTIPAITINVSSNLTITYVNACPTSIVGNLTSDVAHTTACSCTGCQYTSTVYFSGGSIGTGTQLYYDAALTQKVTGKTWFRAYSGASVVWPINSTGLISGASQSCP